MCKYLVFVNTANFESFVHNSSLFTGFKFLLNSESVIFFVCGTGFSYTSMLFEIKYKSFEERTCIMNTSSFEHFSSQNFGYQKKMFWNVTTEYSCRSFVPGFISEALTNHIYGTINNPQFSLRTTSPFCNFMVSRFLACKPHHLHMCSLLMPLVYFLVQYLYLFMKQNTKAHDLHLSVPRTTLGQHCHDHWQI